MLGLTTLGMVALGSVVAAGPAAAATFQVTLTTDYDPSGAAVPGTFRYAVEQANLTSGVDVITFAPGLGSIVLTDYNQIEITEPVTITGPGVTIDVNSLGGGPDNAFYVDAGTADHTTISGLTVTGGDGGYYGGAFELHGSAVVLDGVTLTGNRSSEYGGAIYADGGSLTITDSTIVDNYSDMQGGGLNLDGVTTTITGTDIQGNEADGSEGAGIYVSGGTLDMAGGEVSGNHTTDSGGGLYTTGGAVVTITGTLVTQNQGDSGGGLYSDGSTVTITDATIVDNHATDGAGVFADNGSVSIQRSTISGNTAAGWGGAVAITNYAELEVSDTTVSGNTAPNGGAAVSAQHDATTTIVNSTITGNTSTNNGAVTAGLPYSAGPVSMDHVTVADNSTPYAVVSTSGLDVANSIITGSAGEDLMLGQATLTASYTLFGTAFAATDGVDGNLVGADPQLSALGAHGGPTETMLPAVSSPVVDAGDPAYSATSTDQRGLARVAAAMSGGTARTDMGAVERAAPVAAPGVPQNVVSTAGEAQVTVTWAAPVSGGPVDHYVVTLSDGQTCTVPVAGPLSCLFGGTAGTVYTASVVAVAADATTGSAATGVSTAVSPPAVPTTPPTTQLTLTTDQGILTHVTVGQDLVVLGTGFLPYSTATIVIYSTPTVLGTVVTDGNGNFSKPVTVPTDLVPGTHMLVASGIAPDGSPRFLRMDVQIEAAVSAPVQGSGPGSSTLAFTGASPAVPLTLGGAFLAAGGLFLGLSRRRRAS